jgi:hypothetical protein
MKTNIYLLLAGIPLWLFSCIHLHEDASVEVIELRYTDQMELKLSDFVESIELIPLETTEESLIGNMSRIESTPSLYYIGMGQWGPAEQILVFRKDGTYLTKIDKKGPGPNEYTTLWDYRADKNSNLIVSGMHKIFMYDFQRDSFYLTHNIEAISPIIAPIIDDDILLYLRGGGFLSKEKTEHDDTFLRLKANGETSTFFQPTEEQYKRMRYFTVRNFSSSEGKIYFSYAFCDTIFEIRNDQLYPVYAIDFGSKKLPADIFKDAPGATEMNRKLTAHQGVRTIGVFYITPHYVYFSFGTTQRIFYRAFYYPATKKVLMGNTFIDDMFFVGSKIDLNSIGVHFEGEYMLCSVQPPVLLDRYQEAKERLDETEWDAFCEKHPRLVSVCENLTSDDNPVLLKIKIKL